MVVPSLVSGVHVENVWAALIAAAVLGFLNGLVWQVFYLFALPCAVLTLGLSIVVVNALLFQLAGVLVPGFSVDSFWSAIWASLFVSLVSWISHFVFNTRDIWKPYQEDRQPERTRKRHPSASQGHRSKGPSTIDLEQDENGTWR